MRISTVGLPRYYVDLVPPSLHKINKERTFMQLFIFTSSLSFLTTY